MITTTKKLKRFVSYTAYALTIYSLPHNNGYNPVSASQCRLSMPAQLHRPLNLRHLWRMAKLKSLKKLIANRKELYGGVW